MITIGIDIGTSAIKAIAMNECGVILSSKSRTYPLLLSDNGWSEQEPQDWWRETTVALRELTAVIPTAEIAAISFSGQMHGLVALDEDGNILRHAILWNDQRTQAECDYLNYKIGKSVLLDNTANIALTGFTAPKILWMRQHEPELFSRIAKIMLPKDYIAYKLSGVFATDFSDASGTLLLDVKNRDWSPTLLNIVGLTHDQLPVLYESYQPIGYVTQNAAHETGLPTSVQVVIGGGDQAVGAIGTGTVHNGMCSISLGTSGVLFVAADDFAVDTGPSAIHSFCHATGRFHMMGVTLAAAGSTKWWVEDILGITDYDKEQANITHLGENEVYYLPYLSGERTPHNSPDARGTFVGMSMTTTRADMMQAVLEGVAYSLRDILSEVRALGHDVTIARIIGGGAKSTLWCQIIADVLQLPIERINASEGPAFGAAILAMVGAGRFTCVQEACDVLIQTTDRFIPNEKNAAAYSRRYKIYTELYSALAGSFSAMAST